MNTDKPAGEHGPSAIQRFEERGEVNSAGALSVIDSISNRHHHLAFYLDTVYGQDKGFIHWAKGIDGFYDSNGKYKQKLWLPQHHHWPDQRKSVLAEMIAAADDCDVYVCPYLMVAKNRTKGEAVARRLVHADIDNGMLDADKVRQLGGFAVASGSRGNGHAYISLTDPVTAREHDALCRALGAHLGAVDSKVSDNDVLRPPGTFNHKSAAAGHGAPTPVEWVVEP